jgi:catechol 2,3-dioxygenase-like lactoylglutathione lyase family enzyme
MIESKTPSLKGIHHLKLAVTDLDVSLAFYEKLFDAIRIPEADHRSEANGELYAYILDVPNLGTKLELRLNPEQAQRHRYFDPITIAVEDRRALENWYHFLDERRIPHSPIIAGIQAWLIVIEDPDKSRLRLYTLETHGRDVKPDENNPWLRN